MGKWIILQPISSLPLGGAKRFSVDWLLRINWPFFWQHLQLIAHIGDCKHITEQAACSATVVEVTWRVPTCKGQAVDVHTRWWRWKIPDPSLCLELCSVSGEDKATGCELRLAMIKWCGWIDWLTDTWIDIERIDTFIDIQKKCSHSKHRNTTLQFHTDV